MNQQKKGNSMKYNVIVVGGGHAGIEAALASARMGQETLLITGNLTKIGSLPCNPSIGGPAKGVVVREIDALGGEMGRNTDKTYIQMRMLNLSKGPAVRALRAQIDKVKYPEEIQHTMKMQPQLSLLEGFVDSLVVEAATIQGILMEDGTKIDADAVVLTTGTYMQSKVLVGQEANYAGPQGERPSMGLSDSIRQLGFKTYRLKTGTPPRLHKDSIDYSKATIQSGDVDVRHFSFDANAPMISAEDQAHCWLIHTTQDTHDVINANLGQSSMYSGVAEGVGPRYCPSIEDKIVRFSDKPRHQVFLEPESLFMDTIYVQGMSTSMPREIQEQMIRSLPGLEHAKFIKYAYAIEYDAIDPTQLSHSLETKLVKGLFTAGQVNGTSGYEEAAGQGLMAGINAALSVAGKDPLILGRDEAYIGVMIDDLVTKGTEEPYRLLTSRSEFRLLLRHDNADTRLLEKGFEVGLVSQARYEQFLIKQAQINQELLHLQSTRVFNTKETNAYLSDVVSAPLSTNVAAYDLLKRPELTYYHVKELLGEFVTVSEDVASQIEVQIKYQGYIDKSLVQSDRLKKLEHLMIPDSINYDSIHNLATEAREKLKKITPRTIGQAMRISGINPSDISTLMVHLRGRA
jgi:tRNA uridine 5-carboxymethylaminomethyl modification enzyme